MRNLENRWGFIAAVSANNGLGKDNDLIVKNKQDMQFFRKTTINHIVITGRKNWEAMGKRGLPHRTNIVITTDPVKMRNENPDANVFFVAHRKEVFRLLKQINRPCPVYVIGGRQIYNLFADLYEFGFLTRWENDVPADVHFDLLELDTTNPYTEAHLKDLDEDPVGGKGAIWSIRFDRES
jgi:dihydrofolate reductase